MEQPQDNLPAERERQRAIVQNYTRELELDEEARAPSGDDHLLKVLNSPIKSAIKAIEKDNEKLRDRIENGGIFEEDGVTPQIARDLLHKNIKSLTELRNSLAKSPSGDTKVGLEINLGGVFSDALERARETEVDAKVVGGPEDEL